MEEEKESVKTVGKIAEKEERVEKGRGERVKERKSVFSSRSSVYKLTSTSQSCVHKEIYKTGLYRPAFQVYVFVYV